MKICIKCKLEKEESEFYKFRSNVCKCCVRVENKRAQVKHRKSGRRREYSLRYWKTNMFKNSERKYRETEKFKKYHREYQINRYRNSVQHKLVMSLRNRLRMALKNDCKVGSAVRDLGCTIVELRIYLEERFEVGMSWENWGRGEGKWHIDHKYPLSKVDLTDREQLLRVCHYTNLQPLWASENIRKGNSVC